MPQYVVKKGDCLSSIAAEHGLPWKVLWADPKNANLKRKRKDPNVLMPGDVVFVPDTRERMEDCATEDRHRFRTMRGRTLLRIVLKDEEDGPFTSQVSPRGRPVPQAQPALRVTASPQAEAAPTGRKSPPGSRRGG